MYTYRIDLDSSKGEVKAVRTRKQLSSAYSAWYDWTADTKGQSFSFSYFTAWDKDGNVAIADIA